MSLRQRISGAVKIIWPVRLARTGRVVGYYTGPMPPRGTPHLQVWRGSKLELYRLNWTWQHIEVDLAAAMHRLPGYVMREMTREA